MSQNNNTTKERKFKHLTEIKRGQIEILLKQGMPKATIAKEFGIARSTLYNELERGTVKQIDTNLEEYNRYFADAGQRVYEEHRKNSRKPLKIMKAYDFIKYAEKQILEEKQSPDSICGREKLKKCFKEVVCTKTLYNYIDKCLLKVRNIDLPLRVKLNTKIRKVREHRHILGQSIEQRPQYINERIEYGHWEIDTVVGKREKSAVFLTLDERVSRHRYVVKIPAKDSYSVNQGLRYIFDLHGSNADKVFKTITSDNGAEFSKLSEVIDKSKIFYAHPNSSFERGTNEKQNSLIRRFFPKGKCLDNVSDEKVLFLQNWINNLPRKILNYSTPNELFAAFINSL